MSLLEKEFLDLISNEREQEEMKFHMQKEQQEHLVEQCGNLRLELDLGRW